LTTSDEYEFSHIGVQNWTLAMEKQVGARVMTVLEDPWMLAVHKKFGGKVFRRSSVFHGLGQFLAKNEVFGSCCFEIGTWNGLTAALLSRHFKHVVTVDVAHCALKQDILNDLGITNVECINITDNEGKPKVIKKMLDRGLKIDCAYLDGNHAEDTEDDWNLTKRFKRVIFHEVWPFQSPVWGLVHSLPPETITYGGVGLAMWDTRV